MEHLGSLFRRYDRIFIFDTETTGLHFERDEIIQFSGVVLECAGGQAVVSGQYDRLLRLRPKRPLRQLPLRKLHRRHLPLNKRQEQTKFSKMEVFDLCLK